MNRILNITKVPTESVALAWLSFIIDQFDLLVMTESQMHHMSPSKSWTVLRGVPIQIVGDID